MAARRRIDKACVRCRRRKERCDGRQPTCSSCLAHGSDCVYNWQQKKRGLPEGWVHTLEKLFALAMAKYPKLQETLLQTIGDGLDEDAHVFAALWTDNDNEESLWKAWKSSLLATRLEDLVHRLEHLSRRKLSDCQGDALTLFWQKELSDLQQANPRDACAYYVPDNFSLGDIRVPPNVLELLEVYFVTTHSWMPVVEKHTIYHSAYQLHERWSDIPTPDACCLLAVLSCVRARSEDRQGLPEFGHIARNLVPQRAADLRLSHAKALLVLSLTEIQTSQLKDAWLLVGEACQVALLTLNSESKDSNLVADRIIMACFIVDTLLSSRLHIPAHLSWKDVPEIGSLEEDGMEEWSPAYDCFEPGTKPCPMLTNSSFNRLYTIVRILSQVEDATSTEEKDKMRADLDRWRSQQTENFPLGSGTNRPMLPTQTIVLLVYFETALMLDTKATTGTPALQLDITNFLLLLRQYTKSTIKPSHIPAIWEPTLTHLLELLGKCVNRGDGAAVASIDALVAMVSELDGTSTFAHLRTRCADIGSAHTSSGDTMIRRDLQIPLPNLQPHPHVIEVPSLMDMTMADGSTSLSTLIPGEVEQEEVELITADALEAEVDWNATLRDLGFADGENLPMALEFLNE